MAGVLEAARESVCFLCAQGGVVSAALIGLALLLVWSWKRTQSASSSRLQGRPLPGPTGLPLLGCLPFLGPRLFVACNRLQKRYGDIFVVPIGMQKFVFLNSYDAIREALVNQADKFSGRFRFELVQQASRNSGILFKDGPVWQEHRRFALRVMRDFGLGRSHSEEIIVREAELLREQLEAESGVAQDTKQVFSRSVSNVISQMSFGDRSGHEDPGFGELMERIDKMVDAGSFASLLPIIFPFVNRHQWLYAPVEFFLRLSEHTEWAHNFVRRKIDEHHLRLFGKGEDMNRAEYGPEEANDFCDALLIEQHRLNATGESHTFTEWQLIRNLFELFIAGTDTTALTLCWAWVLLSLNPKVQTDVHEELDRVVGRSRLPRMADRKACHMVNAVLDEILRFSTIAPFALPHRTTEDAVVHGLAIPSDVIVMPNLYAVHHDPRLWAEPEEFRPERFLDPDTGAYRPSEHLIVFGMGRRACLGEALARMELFLFFTVLMQHLSVRLQEPRPPVEELLLGNDGTVRHLCRHRIIFDTRAASGDERAVENES